MEMGIYSGTGTLTAQQKVLAAHQVVLSQTTDAQGDFARTADGMANSQKILTARLEEAKITLGEALLPIALNVVNLFNDKFLPIIEKIAGAFSSPDGKGLTDKVKQFVDTGRDFLNPIIDATRQAFEKVSEAISTNRGNFESILNAIKTVYDFFVTYFVPFLKFQVVNAIEGIGTAFSTVAKVVGPIVGFIGDVVGGIVSTVDRAIKAIVGLVNNAIDGINKVIAAYNRVSILKDIPSVPKIGTSGTTTNANNVPTSSLPFGGANIGGGSTTTASSAIGSGLVGNALGTALAAGLGGGAGTKGAGTTPGMTLIERVTQENFLKSLETNFDVAAFRRGEEADRQVVINVNSPSIIDQNGFTAAVVEALNQTQRRTGGGGSQLVL
jgi:phage-related protein